MPLFITHTSGPLAGRTATFADDKTKIVVGRDPALCDIVYPPDLTIIGREHCAFVRQLSGDYTLEIFGDHYVEVDGAAADNGINLRSDARLTLGRHDGPSLSIRIDHSAVSFGLSRTVAQPKVASARAQAGRARALAAVGLFAALAVGGGLAWQWRAAALDRETQVQARAEFERGLAQFAAAQKSVASDGIARADRERLADSVYAVAKRNRAGDEDVIGTAWAVAPDLMATNAHVAKEFGKLASNETFVVRPQGMGNYGYLVSDVVIHPGYDKFQALLQEDSLFVKQYRGSAKAEAASGYDVALLRVSGTVPAEKIFTIASQTRLEALRPGEPVAYAGFPYERLAGDAAQSLGRTPQIQIGNITAVTDYFFLPAVSAQRRFVQHNLPATGGASGSPIIDANGEVVALLNGGNILMVDDARTPNAAEINFAQRADVLRDLMNNAASATVQRDESYWRERVALFQKGVDVVIAELLEAERPRSTNKAARLSRQDVTVAAEDRCTRTDANGSKRSIRCRFFTISGSPGARTVVASARSDRAIGAVDLMVDGKMIRSKELENQRAIALTFDMPPNGKISIAVETPDVDTSFVFEDYRWGDSSS